MIELEIQVLSEKRDGLLIDIGRCAMSNGFTLQRQRVTQDVHGALLSMVVRGARRKRRALESALEAHERVISYELSAFVEGEVKPHFAAARTYPQPPLAAAPIPVPVSAPVPAAGPATLVQATANTMVGDFSVTAPVRAVAEAPARVHATVPAAVPAEPVGVAVPVAAEPDFDFILPEPPRPVATVPEPEMPFVDLVRLDPDLAAVDKALRSLELEYPQIMPRLLTLDGSVEPGARESSLLLAGRRTGAWVFARRHAKVAAVDLPEAIEQIGVPALRELVEVEQKGVQVHIRNSPLCTEHDHSGCSFFSGYLEGVLGPVLGAEQLSIFPVCCRSFGADACVLALST